MGLVNKIVLVLRRNSFSICLAFFLISYVSISFRNQSGDFQVFYDAALRLRDFTSPYLPKDDPTPYVNGPLFTIFLISLSFSGGTQRSVFVIFSAL